MNKAIIAGKVGKDCEVRFTSTGQAVANFSVATSERFTKDGEKQERTEWHDVVVWGKQAEAAGEWIKKGASVLVEGRIEKHKYQDKEGNDRMSVNIVATNWEFTGGKSASTSSAPAGDPTGSVMDEDDVPF